MRTSKLGLAAFLAVMIAAGAFGVKALAQAEPKQEPAVGSAAGATETSADKAFIKVSDDAFNAMRDVRATRLAIFDGMPDAAKQHVNSALHDIAATAKEAPKLALDVKKPMKEGDLYVPFDVQLAVADSFVPSPEKTKHIAEANEHLKKGARKQAMDVLKLADIDVVYSAALIPVAASQKLIQDAAKLIDAGKYYEANVALKAVDDSVVINTFGVDEAPPTAKKNAG